MRIDLVAKLGVFVLALFGIGVLLLMFGFILKEAFPAYRHYGFWHMYFSADFSATGGWGIWGALAITLIVAILAVIIALPLALRASFFICYRLKHGKRAVRIIINVLAGVPSVVFGIFALSSLGSFTETLGFMKPTTVFTGTLVLVIMIFPTMVSLITNQLDVVADDLIHASLSLGNTKTYSLYHVVKKAIRQGVYVAAIVALGRAIGETMALSMILQVSPMANPLANGVVSFFHSSGASLGVMIARNMFSDATDPYHRSALFAAGIALFVVVMLLIAVVTKISRGRLFKLSKPLEGVNKAQARDQNGLGAWCALAWQWTLVPGRVIIFAGGWLVEQSRSAIDYLRFWLGWPLRRIMYSRVDGSQRSYYAQAARRPAGRITDWTRIMLEVISLVIILGSALWIMVEVFVRGFPEWRARDWVWSYHEWTPLGLVERPGIIANTLVFTIVLVFLALVIAIPFVFATALYLAEYARNRRSGKVIRFFLDALGGTPSIIFGMFGVIFFRQTLNLGHGGFSLLAGALTMTIVIIPTFARSIEQALVKIPVELRMASYSLGASKFETIRKVILPQALPGIMTGIILSAGRIISETAPIYLTIGMLGSVALKIDGSGWTMTTKILYNQLFATGDATALLKQSYAIAAATLLLITALILLAEATLPIVRARLVTRYIIIPMRHQLARMSALRGRNG